MAIVVCLEVYSYSLTFSGASLNAAAAGLTAIYLLPLTWLLVESVKRRSPEGLALGQASPLAR